MTLPELLGPDGEARALDLDGASDRAMRRDEFAIPSHDGRPVAYLAGNSLGLRSRGVDAAVAEVMATWGERGVHGHFTGAHSWVTEPLRQRPALARLVGARDEEVIVMNTLTVNLHAMLDTFYRPVAGRHRVAIEHDAFPSDRYAVDSRAELHGFAASDAVLALRPAPGAALLDAATLARMLEQQRGAVAVVLLAGVHFRTGALLDIAALTKVIHDAGALAGWDLAHAVGNVELSLHEWDVDFAVWCTYKYCNAGPGSLGACFVHERHGSDPTLVRPAGWSGHDAATRFAMPERFAPERGAAGWQVSTPPALSLAAVRGAMELFDEVGMHAVRARSLRLTGFLADLLDAVCAEGRARVVTPRDPQRRGAQLSVEVRDAASVAEALFAAHGVVADDRPPSIVRLAPAPLYNTFHDCWRAAAALYAVLHGDAAR